MDTACVFEFVVSDPQKAKGDGKLDLGYWVYSITTKTSLDQYSNKTPTVSRRYNDFLWLRDQLAEENPGVIVPPIPDKEMKGTIEKLGGSTTPLLEYRQRALRKFLVRTGAHPVLHSSALFQEFLEGDDLKWAVRMKSTKKKETVAPVQSTFLQRLGFGSKPAEINSQGYSKALETGTATTSTMWTEAIAYISQLETSLHMLKDRIEALGRRRKETATILRDFGKSFARVGEVEAEFESSALSQAIIDVGHHSEHLSLVYVEQADEELVQVAESLGYYIGMCTAVKEVIRKTQGYQAEYDRLVTSVQDSVAQRDKLVAKGAGADKRAKVEAEITANSARRDELADISEKSQAMLRDELRRFHREKQYDVKQILRSFVELQLQYSTKMRKSWECMMPQIEQIKL
eukprot:PhM_4_TR16626/c0_g1_i1/m.9077/K17917/SNX1_2; sorting nexin-1/2